MADQEAEEELDEQEQLERDELDREIRINKALQTMEKELHVSQAVVKLVLLKLLKVGVLDWNLRFLMFLPVPIWFFCPSLLLWSSCKDSC